MAEEQTGQERTEEPTERRLQEARKKGQVPRSKELNTMLRKGYGSQVTANLKRATDKADHGRGAKLTQMTAPCGCR